MSEVAAILRGAQLSAQKARLVADQIRGKNVSEALTILEFSPKKGADVDELNVSTIFVDEGTTMKRIRPRAKGRADRILKRSCHITIKVSEK